jgi:DNA-binding NarL/FixJ family response regulator
VCDLAPTVRAANPDLLLLDLGLKDGNALPHIHALREEFSSLRILVLSQCDENQYAETALRSGAHGYIMKERATDEVLDAIRSVLQGEIHLSPQLAVRLSNQFSGIRPPASIPALDHLSARELQVLQLIGAGLGTREVADQLGLGIKTVETYREKLKFKLNLTDAVELVSYAKGLLEDKSLLQTPAPTNANLASSPPSNGTVSSVDCRELAPDK